MESSNIPINMKVMPPSKLKLSECIPAGTISQSIEMRDESSKVKVEVKEEAEEMEDEEMEVGDEEDLDDETRSSTKGSSGVASRAVTLQMLLNESVLEPGDGLLSIDYLGQKFTGDLLPCGKIKSQETDEVFGSPSAWAIYCKKIVNPEKKSGCGWASVKYKGKKLDAYKNLWLKKKRIDQGNNENDDIDPLEEMKLKPVVPRAIVKHSNLGVRSSEQDQNMMVETMLFSSTGKLQPFTISVSLNAMILMDFHSHLTSSEIVGYLGGHWDVNRHHVSIEIAFPCRCRLGDKANSSQVEFHIYNSLKQKGLSLLGWYHSHPNFECLPTLRDIDSQLEYQIKMKGNNDAAYLPCTGFICAPYLLDSDSLDCQYSAFWAIPPPDSKPNEYGKPMKMEFSLKSDSFVTPDTLNEMKLLVNFYKNGADWIKFKKNYRPGITFVEKVKRSVSRFLPANNAEKRLVEYIQEIIS